MSFYSTLILTSQIENIFQIENSMHTWLLFEQELSWHRCDGYITLQYGYWSAFHVLSMIEEHQQSSTQPQTSRYSFIAHFQWWAQTQNTAMSQLNLNDLNSNSLRRASMLCHPRFQY